MPEPGFGKQLNQKKEFFKDNTNLIVHLRINTKFLSSMIDFHFFMLKRL